MNVVRPVDMGAGGSVTARKRRAMHAALLVTALVGLALALPAAAGATILSPWGSNLSATPTLDTANGDYSNAGSTVGPENTIAPNPHEAEDLGVWNAAASAGATAPQGGQALYVKVKGCAIKDTTAPTDSNGDQYSEGTRVNTIVFQTLAPQGRDWAATATSGQFLMPFCKSADSSGTRVTPDYVSTFQPIHMCVAAGGTIAFHDIGGFIPPNGSGGPWYPQGVPMDVIATAGSSSINSFVGVGASTYGPGLYGPGEPDPSFSGWGSEPGKELMLQVIEGVGDDAYGLCPGGTANEPSNSNSIICVSERASAEGHPTCNGNNQPVYWPANTSRPKISGKAQQDQRLTESHGEWTNNPYGYRVRWEDCDSSGANCTAIAGATKQYYYPTAGYVGHTLRVQEWATNDANTVGPVSSSPTAPVAPVDAPSIANLKLNPSTFYDTRAATVTYLDSQAATTTLTVIALKTKAVVKMLAHRDRAGSNGVGGLSRLKAGRYVLRVSATFQGQTSQPVTVSFMVKASHHKHKRHGKRRRQSTAHRRR